MLPRKVEQESLEKREKNLEARIVAVDEWERSMKAAVAGRTGQTEEQVMSGWIGRVPEGRLGRPEELAQAITFLASPAGAYIRGQSLAVDGGRLNTI